MWDRKKAVRYLIQNAQPSSRGRCAEYVRMAIEAGGLRPARRGSAKDVGESLLALGFETSARIGSSLPQVADIAIVQPIVGHPHGHICMFDGCRWISDFVQNYGVHPGPAYRAQRPPFAIYRYPFAFGSEFFWRDKGFARPPQQRRAPVGGVVVYRCWGGPSSFERPDMKSDGFFSAVKPRSVVDAELRFNIADWGNRIHFVSTFRLREGFPFWVGPVFHGPFDAHRATDQLYVEPPVPPKVIWIAKELLAYDAFVGTSGNA